MRLTIGKKLVSGFGALMLLMVATAVIAHIKIAAMRKCVAEVVEEAFPTITACDRLMSGMNQSAAALRGYIILSNDPQRAASLKVARAEGWSEIDEAFQELTQLAADLTSGQSAERIEKLRQLLDEARSAQQAVEDVAHSDQNVPARYRLQSQAAPMVGQMLDALATAIDEEVQQEPSAERRQVLKLLADARSSLADILADAREYVWSGDADRRAAVDRGWTINEAIHGSIAAQLELLTPSQRRHWEQYSELRSEFSPLLDEILTLREGADWHQSNFLFATKSMPLATAVRATLDEITEAAETRKDQRVIELNTASRTLTSSLLLATTLAIGIGMLLAILMSRQISGAVRRLADRAQQISNGDLTGSALLTKSTDELGQLANGFDVMLTSLRDLTGQIYSVTENVNSAAAQISSSAKQQAASSKEQAATVQEITSTMQEISQSGSQIVDKAREVASAAEATAAASKSGIEAVQTTSSTMHAIREQVEEVAENIVALSEKTQAVGDIIATVTDVAEQSNLLALNATIEAAGAGEGGNRFSAVASEMKNLADQAKSCTVQVRTILSEIQKGINGAVMLTEEAVKRVEAGKHQAEVSEQSIRQMSDTTKQSVQAFQQIIAATNQQQVGFDQVTQGMRDIDMATQQTATGTSQLEQAVLSLSVMSQQLKLAVASYRV